MKKILRILLVLFLSFLFIPNVFATESVTIDSVTLDSKSDNAEVLNEATYDGISIKFDLKFNEVNDYAKYKIIINNPTDTDYEISKNSKFNNSRYISYKYSYESDNNIVKNNSKTTMYINIKYNKEVPKGSFTNGSFIDTNSLVIDLSNNTLDVLDINKNPNTKDNFFVIILVLIVTIGISLVLYKTSKKKKVLGLIIISIALLPISIYAVEKLQIKVESKVEINGIKISGTIYRYDSKILKNGDSIFSKKVKKWLIINDNDIFISSLDDEVQYSFDTKEKCELYIDQNISSLYGENFSCIDRKFEFGLGNFDYNASNLNKQFYLKHDVVNNIVKTSYVCFIFNNQEYCMQGGFSGENDSCMDYDSELGYHDWSSCAPIFNNNYNNFAIIRNSHPGMCFFSRKGVNNYGGETNIECERSYPLFISNINGLAYISDSAVYSNRYNENIDYCVVTEDGYSLCI